MKKLVLALATILGVSTTANAGVMIEPYLGYGFGSYEEGGVEMKQTGTALGARLAYELDLVAVSAWFGLDASKSVSMEAETKFGGTTNTTDIDKTTVGVAAGVEFPILVRAWVGYNFLNDFKPDGGGKSEGKATKLGVGFTGLPFVSLNLEYIKETYEGNAGNPDQDFDMYMLSVSLPLSF